MAVGYIVGVNVAIVTVIGGILNWYVGIPILTALNPEWAQGPDAVATAQDVWNSKTRYIGVGAMVIGGLWALVALRKPLMAGIRSGLAAYRAVRKAGNEAGALRTERDLPMNWILWAIAASVVPLFLIFWHVSGDAVVAAVMAVVMLIAGFLFSAVAGYMAGIVGSSNNPVSGVTIATILVSSLLLLAMAGGSVADPLIGRVLAASAVLIGATVCCSAAIAGDNLQDLKAGHLVGATPWKLQVMQWVGAISAALIMAPVLNMLLDANGIGDVGGTDPSKRLAAPQAALMASVARGVFEGGLPWDMIAIGVVVGAIVIVIDEVLKAKKTAFRVPVLAMAIGIYLPLYLTVAIAIGGIISHVAHSALSRRLPPHSKPMNTEAVANQHGLLFAAGLITGEALLGILLAIPIVISDQQDYLPSLIGGSIGAWWPGLVAFFALLYVLYRIASKPPREQYGE